ncbi:MAG: hypothetical protein MPJ22_03365 [Pirellulales bacterium]|nr:hypothetical protein [Pirellulales bacterium]
MKSAKFLGYDPGGMGKPGHAGRNGVAVAQIAEDGSILCESTQNFRVVREVYGWLKENSADAVALGIDTLLAWSIDGNRTCDEELWNKYYAKFGKVLSHQGSLEGAMAINGMLVAKKARGLKIPIFESHPKLLLRIIKEVDEQGGNLLKACNKKMKESVHDDEADALVGAWCASRWYFGKWKDDLYLKTGQKGLHFPAGKAVYPWPESLS